MVSSLFAPAAFSTSPAVGPASDSTPARDPAGPPGGASAADVDLHTDQNRGGLSFRGSHSILAGDRKEASNGAPKPQPIIGQDPVTVDPEHYRVESEDDQVRVLRVQYPPKAKSVMHGHPASVAIFLRDAECRFTFPDGRTEDHKLKAGQTIVKPAMEHPPENTGAQDLEVILVELKR